MVDVGASYGNYSLTAALMGASTIFAFEPEPTVYIDLHKNIELNKWQDKFHDFNMGLWSNSSMQNMKEYAPHWPAATITTDYQMTTLDDVVASNKIDRLDWIKIDCEGAEEHVIKGGLKTIKKFHPKMIIECHTFLDKDLKDKVKSLILSCGSYEYGFYEFEEIERDPCVMLIAKCNCHF